MTDDRANHDIRSCLTRIERLLQTIEESSRVTAEAAAAFLEMRRATEAFERMRDSIRERSDL